MLKRLRLFAPKVSTDPCAKCPSCETCFRFGKKSFYCPQCSSIQNTDGITNYFSLLGIKQGFNVNVKDAEMRYRALQKVVHPDHLSQTNPGESSTDYCALLNEAIAAIKSPLKRAEHILQLHNTSTDDSSRLTDELINEMMDDNEAVDDAIGDRNALENCLLLVNKKLTACEANISRDYAAHDFPSMLTQVERMRFLSRIETRIQDLLRY